MLAKDLTVGQLAKRSQVAISTLHFYEQKGLLESWRTPANHRRYSRHALRRVAIIRAAQKAGIKLEEIKKMLAHLPHDKAITQKDWNEIARLWQAGLNDWINRLTKLRDNLDGCIGCGCLSLDDCPLRNPDDEAGKNNDIASFLEISAKEP